MDEQVRREQGGEEQRRCEPDSTLAFLGNSSSPGLIPFNYVLSVSLRHLSRQEDRELERQNVTVNRKQTRVRTGSRLVR